MRARLQCEAATSLVTVGDERGLAYLQDARAVLDPEQHPVATANAMLVEGRFRHLRGGHRAAIELCEGAVALLARHPESGPGTDAANALIAAYGYISGAYQHLGLFDDGDMWARRAVEYGVTHRLPGAEALGYEFLAENATSVDAGTIPGARGAERAIAERIHSRERLAWTYMPTAMSSWGLAVRPRSCRD